MGLVGWDAAWYHDIAHGGYGDVAKVGLRFFPLFPMLARAVSWVPGVDSGLAVVLLSNISAFAVGMLVFEFARREGRELALARRVGVDRVSRTFGVRVRDGLRGSDVHDRVAGRADRVAQPPMVGRRDRWRGCRCGATVSACCSSCPCW